MTMPPAAVGQTPVYGLKYIAVGAPARWTREVLQLNAETIEAALIAGGIAPPAAGDLATLSGRVSALEGSTALAATAPSLTAGWTPYVDASVPWNGVRYWRHNKSVTVAGALTAASARSNGDVMFTLPSGCRPPVSVQAAVYASAPYNVVVTATGSVKLSGTAASGSVISFTATFVAS